MNLEKGRKSSVSNQTWFSRLESVYPSGTQRSHARAKASLKIQLLVTSQKAK